MRRKALWTAALAVVVLLTAAAALAGLGSRETYDRADGPAPDWARPCFRRAPRQDRPLLHFCARVRGRVLHIRHTHPTVTHVAVVARFRIFVVRLETSHAPRVGSTITAIGPVLRVKYGLQEVQAFETP